MIQGDFESVKKTLILMQKSEMIVSNFYGECLKVCNENDKIIFEDLNKEEIKHSQNLNRNMNALLHLKNLLKRSNYQKKK